MVLGYLASPSWWEGWCGGASASCVLKPSGLPAGHALEDRVMLRFCGVSVVVTVDICREREKNLNTMFRLTRRRRENGVREIYQCFAL